MKPTQQLVFEHDNILMLLKVLDRLGELASEGEAPLERIAAAIDLVRGYADEMHHSKEENLLFPLLEARGIPRDGGPIGCMLAEHETGRDAVADMSCALDRMRKGAAGAGDDFASAASAYVGLLYDHIDKENQVLFPWAEDVFTDQDRAELIASFGRVESDEIGAERLSLMLEKLQSLYEEFIG